MLTKYFPEITPVILGPYGCIALTYMSKVEAQPKTVGPAVPWRDTPSSLDQDTAKKTAKDTMPGPGSLDTAKIRPQEQAATTEDMGTTSQQTGSGFQMTRKEILTDYTITTQGEHTTQGINTTKSEATIKDS